MATSAGEVEVKLTLNADDFQKILQKSQGDLQSASEGMETSTIAIGAAIAAALAAIGAFLKDALNSFATYQTAVTRLTAALTAQGLATDDTIHHLTSFANQLQETTGVTQENVLAAQAMLTTYGLSGKTLDDATVAALNLSAAMGIDLERAASLLGKAYDGNTSSLSRYGILINKHIDTSQKFAAVMDQVNQRFGGAAQAQADTYTGRMNIMKGAFNDLEIEIGAMLAGPIGDMIVKVTSMIKIFTDWVSITATLHSEFGGFTSMLSSFMSSVFSGFINSVFSFEQQIISLLDKIPGLHTAAAVLNLDLFDAKNKLDAETAAWQKNMTTAQATLTAKKAGNQAALASQVDLTKGVVDASASQTQAVKDQMNEQTKAYSQAAAAAKTAYIDFGKSFVTTQAEMWSFATSMSGTFFSGFGDGFAKMIVEGQNFSESMKALFKNMAEQLISYIVQIILKLTAMFLLESALGFPVGGAMAGIGAFATGGVITEPSIMVGLRTGSKTMVGEAGPETVSPMNGGNQDSGGGGSSSGGGASHITVNISGQFLEGDQTMWRQMVNQQIIPAIRRFTMSSPTGPFNRTRGTV